MKLRFEPTDPPPHELTLAPNDKNVCHISSDTADENGCPAPSDTAAENGCPAPSDTADKAIFCGERAGQRAFWAKGYASMPTEAKEIREEVFVREQGFAEEFDEIDAYAVHILLFCGDRAIGTCRIFECDGSWQIGRVALVREFRGRGCGRRLLAAAEAHIQRQGGARCSLHAQTRAQAFYEKCGYRPCGKPFDEEGCPHVAMTKSLNALKNL